MRIVQIPTGGNFLKVIVPILLSVFIHSNSAAQLVDGILGQKRTVVQVLLRPYRIMDYEKNRVVYTIDKGVHQTILYENDTCKTFYWAVGKKHLVDFKNKLLASNYAVKADGSYLKDSLQVTVKPLNSGKATLFMVRLSESLKGDRYASGKKVTKNTNVSREKNVLNFEALPLLQQAILAEENDTIPKPKNPQRHWIGQRSGKTTILGWDK